MSDSRSLDDLDPRVKEKAVAFLAAAKAVGIDLLVTCTLRSMETQAALYAQGRTKPGAIVTNARPGESYHNYRLAFDVVPIINGKCDWNSPRWPEIGRLGEAAGLEWAGRWTGKLRETAHFQWTAGLSIYDLKAGKRP